jgi:integrase
LRLPEARPGAAAFLDLALEWWRGESLRLVEPENERRHINHLEPLWELSEAELRPRLVKEALARLLRPVGPLSAATVNKVRATGRRIIREALLNERWTSPNPFDVVPRLRQTRPTYRTLSLSEVRRLLPCLRPDRRREVLAMLYLGLRPGELKALRREDLDLQAAIIHIRRSNGRDTTKTGKEREVPLPSALVPVLREALAHSPPSCPLVFPGLGGKRQRADAKLARMLRAALRAAGLVTGYGYVCRRRGCGYREERQAQERAKCPQCGFVLWVAGRALAVRYYDLRHSAATLHREAGADPLAIQLALGHSPKSLTDSIYTHLSRDYVRRELDKLRV